MPAETKPAPVREKPAHADGSPTAPLTPAVDARGRHAVLRPRPGEQPVFAATDGRRARRLRIVALVAAALVALWLIALVAGILGFGRLPIVPDVRPTPATPKVVPHLQTPAAAPSSAASSRGPARSRPGAAGRTTTRRTARPQSATGAPRRVTRPLGSSRRSQGGTPASSAPLTMTGRRLGQSGISPPTSSRPAAPPGQERKTTVTTTGSMSSQGQGATHRASATG